MRKRLTTGAAIAVFTIALSGCAGTLVPLDQESSSAPVAEESASPTEEVSPSPTPTVGEMGDALAERDQFFIDQQQPLGQSGLTAKTPAQIELVAQQRAWVESQGGVWTAEAETLLLAVSLDACETSILNNHNVDQSVYNLHVTSSPLFATYATDAATLDGLASMMVFGTSFICPDDSPQWEAGWQASRPAG